MDKSHPEYGSRDHYITTLAVFDAAVCEALAVSQAQAGRFTAANISYASKIFTRMCGSSISMIRAAPLSRWVKSDFEDWQLSAVAGHARSILDGFILFHYLIAPTSSEAELRARINIMHLNDCTRRIELFKNLESTTDDIAGFERQLEELKERLLTNKFFNALTAKTQKSCLSGKYLMIDNRDQMLGKIGMHISQTNAIYDLWSQHIHILPLSFYRTEPEGRGTGIENDTDRCYITQALEICASLMTSATNQIVECFQDVVGVRQGLNSRFSPGPLKNRPPRKKSGYKTLTDACAAQANQNQKVGRNDSCICGSGKKFKKCCLVK